MKRFLFNVSTIVLITILFSITTVTADRGDVLNIEEVEPQSIHEVTGEISKQSTQSDNVSAYTQAETTSSMNAPLPVPISIPSQVGSSSNDPDELDSDPNTGSRLWSGQLMHNQPVYVQIKNGSDVQIHYYLFHTATDPIQNPELGEKPPAAVAPAPVTPGEIGSSTTNPEHMKKGLNKTKLKPGEEYWFKFDTVLPDGSGSKPATLSLFYTPDDNIYQRISMDIYEKDEVRGTLKQFGEGSRHELDSDHHTGTRLWSGRLMHNLPVYVKVKNGADVQIDVWLFYTDNEPVQNAELGEKQQSVATPEPLGGIGSSTANPDHLKMGLNQGKLKPGDGYWYKIDTIIPGGVGFKASTLSLFYTPDDSVYQRVSVNIYEKNEKTGNLRQFGACSRFDLDDDYNTGTRLWSGWLMYNLPVYVYISNGTDEEIDYYLYQTATTPVQNPELGEKSAPPPPTPPGGVGSSTNNPDNTQSLNRGVLEPGEGYWYKIDTVTGVSKGEFKRATLTLFYTPDDNIYQRISFDLYEKDERRRSLKQFGAGGRIELDDDPNTGSRLWSGWLMQNLPVYVYVKNGSDKRIDFWLYQTATNPIQNPELGEKTPPPPPAPPGGIGSSTNNPDNTQSLNKGKLKPGEGYWYKMDTVTGVSKGEFKRATLTLFYTPDDNIYQRISFDLYEKDERRGSLRQFGAGGRNELDDDPNTGSRLWSGWLMQNLPVYVYVKNGSDKEIDYWLYQTGTNPIQNPELGEKTVSTSPPAPLGGVGSSTNNPDHLQSLNMGILKPGDGYWYKIDTVTNSSIGEFERATLTLFYTPDDNVYQRISFNLYEKDELRGSLRQFGAGGRIELDDNHETGSRLWSGWFVHNLPVYVYVQNGSDEEIHYYLYHTVTNPIQNPELGEATGYIAY